MGENLRTIRFYLVLLLIFTVGRWGLSVGGASYDDTHQVFSIVILTFLSSLYYGMITRTFIAGRLKRAMALGALMGIVSQLVILVSTALSYLLGMDGFFNSPRALNLTEAVPLSQAMVIRLQGLVVNTIVNAIMGAIGYGLAKLVPGSR